MTPDVVLRLLSTLIELAGLGLLVWGTYLYDPRAALLVGGGVALLLGYVLDPPKGPDR
jgi:hypothetical protein